MGKYLVLTLGLIFGALALMYVWAGAPRVYREADSSVGIRSRTPHHYQNSRQSLERIHIAAFYFIPRNKVDTQIPHWQNILKENLEKLEGFHALQFQRRSSITYEIYPDAITGLEENLAYDTDVTQHGNPEALRRIAREIEARVFNPSGDLYLPYFVKRGNDSYRVWLVLYEGVGASGSENVALVSRVFLDDPRYQASSASILAHEFYHTLGIPDGYESDTAIPTSQDIMGLGRMRPIEKTFLSRETLQKLGL